MRLFAALMMLLFAAPALADDAWVVQDLASKRFEELNLAGPDFSAGEKVELLFEGAELTRVRKGDRYGWVPSVDVTRERPADAEDGPPGFLELGLPPALPSGSVGAGR